MSDELREAGTSPESQNAQPSRRAQGILQRTAAAISPWVRRWWSGSDPAGTTTTPAPTLRVQRAVSFAAAPAGGRALADRFSHAIVQRHTTADQIGRRYRMEPRQPASPAPAQLPLPGVPSGGRIQRATGEMSLEDLARSYRAEAVDPSSTVTNPAPADMLQREYDADDSASVENIAGQPTSLVDMQDAVRRAAQMRGSEGSTPAVQRMPDPETPATGTPASTFASIEERVRQGRQRAAEQAAAAGTPPPVSIQRSPAGPPPAANAPVAPGESIAAAIRERIRAARERNAGGAPPTAAGSTPPPVQRSPAEPPAPTPPPISTPAPTPPVQRTADVQPPSAPVNYMQGGIPDDAPRELPEPPTSDPSSPGFSLAAAVRDRIQRVREENAAQGRAANELASTADPQSPNFSRAAAIRQRIEEARAQRQPLPRSTDPDDPNFSAAAAIRERIAQARGQRSADPGAAPVQRSPAPSPAVPSPGESAPGESSTADSSQSIAAQIRDRIQAARDQVRSEQSPATPASDAPSVQRTPADRHTIERDLQLKPSPLSSADALQAKRVRARSRSYIMTPERKTGDFTAGETPKPGAMPMIPPRVQRSSAAPPAASTPNTPQAATPQPPAPEKPSVPPVASGADTAPVQRSVDDTVPTPPAADAPVDPTPVDPAGSAPAITPSPAPERMQRTAQDHPASAPPAQPTQSIAAQIRDRIQAAREQLRNAAPPRTAASPASAAPESIQRTPESSAHEPSAGNEVSAAEDAPAESSQPPAPSTVQRAVDTSAPPAPPAPTPSPPAPSEAAPERVQRTPAQHESPVPQSAPPSASPSEESPAADAKVTPPAAAPPRIQCSPDEQGAVTPEAPVSGIESKSPENPPSPAARTKPESVQRTPENRPAGPASAESSEAPAPRSVPPAVDAGAAPAIQREAAPPEPDASPLPTPAAPETPPPAADTVQRSPDPQVESAPPAAADQTARATVQRSAESAPADKPKRSRRRSAQQPTTQQPATGQGAPEQVQRTPEDSAASAPAPAVTEQPATVEPAGADLTATTSASPEIVQRTAAEPGAPARIPDRAAENPPQVERTVSTPPATTPAKSTAAAHPEVTPAPESLQRTAETPAERVPPQVTSDAPAAPAVQRSAAPAPPETTSPPRDPQDVQRTPADRVESTQPAATHEPAPPTVQRSSAPEQRSEPASPAAASESTSMPRVQRAMETPAPAHTPDNPAANTQPAGTPAVPSERVQRTPATDDTGAAAGQDVGDVSKGASGEVARDVVQRKPEAPAPGTPHPATRESAPPAAPPVVPRGSEPAPGPERIQRTPESPVQSTPPVTRASVPTPAAGEAAGAQTEPSSPSAPVSSAATHAASSAPSTAPERVQRTPAATEDRTTSASGDMGAAPPVQRAVDDSTPSDAVAPPSPSGAEVPTAQVTPTTPAGAAPEVVQRTPQAGDKSGSAGEAETLTPRNQSQTMPPHDTAPGGPHAATPTTPTVQRTPDASPSPAVPPQPTSSRQDTSGAGNVSFADKPPPAFLSVDLPPEARYLQRMAQANKKPSVVDLIERRIEEASRSQGDAPAPAGGEAGGIDASGGESALSADVPTIQRAAETAFTNPQISRPSSVTGPTDPGLGDSTIQRTPANEPPPFRPINRYRDPRVLARSTEPSQPAVQNDLALNRSQPAAVLPQARSSSAPVSTQPTTAPTVQRTIAETAALNWPDAPPSSGFGLADLAQFDSSSPAHVQRSPERRTERSLERALERTAERAARRGSTLSVSTTRSTCTSSSTVQRSPLPLAKLSNVANQQVIQRDNDKQDTFIGSSKGNSRRSFTQTENLVDDDDDDDDDDDEEAKLKKKGKKDKEPCDDCDEDKDEKEAKELERLARAILPVVKRMLAIERDRANPRPRF